MNHRILRLLLLSLILCFLFPFSVKSQSSNTGESKVSAGKIALVRAVMCEDIQELIPQNPTTVFSIERRKAMEVMITIQTTLTMIIHHQKG